MKKRLIALFLVLSMVVSVLPVSVFASTETGNGEKETADRHWDTNGDGVVNIVTFGASAGGVTTGGFGFTGGSPVASFSHCPLSLLYVNLCSSVTFNNFPSAIRLT